MSTSTPGDPHPARPGRLNGWKEIAAYLDRGVRSVQRWEKTLGLPVRRIGTGRGEVVYALTEELDAWRDAVERTRDLSERPGERDSEETAAPETTADQMEGAAIASDADAHPAHALPPAEGDRPSKTDFRRPLAAFVLAAAALAVVAIGLWRPWSAPSGEPSEYVMDVDTLRVFDAKGRELWADRFPAPAAREPYSSHLRLMRKDPVVIEDLDGDGSREVVVGYVPSSHDTRGQVRGYGAAGNRLFSTDFEGVVRFGETQYNPPWAVHRLFVTDAPGRGRWLWVAWIHGSGEFPTLLQRLSLDGTVRAALWSAGYVEWVQMTDVGGVPSVLVGAANNDHKGGSLAHFSAHAVGGSLPAETWDKTCRTCPPGGPKKVLVFPRLDVLQLTQGIPCVHRTARQATGEFRVFVDQGGMPPPAGLPWGGHIAYDVSPDLTPVLAEFTADYMAAHDRHHAAGLLDHAFNDADRAAAWPVLVWENGTWTKVTGKTDRCWLVASGQWSVDGRPKSSRTRRSPIDEPTFDDGIRGAKSRGPVGAGPGRGHWRRVRAAGRADDGEEGAGHRGLHEVAQHCEPRALG